MQTGFYIIPGLRHLDYLPGKFKIPDVFSIVYSEKIKPEIVTIFRRWLNQYTDYTCDLLPQAQRKQSFLWIRLSARNACLDKHAYFIEPAAEKDEGYSIKIDKNNIGISAKTQKGMFYGLVTVLHLLKNTDTQSISCCNIHDYPSLHIRGVHLDMKSSFPTVDYIKSIIETLAFYKINTILMEYEDKIRYEKHPVISSPSSLSKEQWREINDYAKRYFIDIIPLQQCLGHVEYILRHRKYLTLAENRQIQQLCPSNIRAKKLIEEIIGEILEIHPDCRYFHLGGDEAFHLGECRLCRKQNRDKLYLDWITHFIDYLNSKGKIPVIWDDMIRHMETGKLEKLKDRVTLMYWQYGPSKFTERGYFFEKTPEYAGSGFSVIGAAGAKGVGGFFTNLPSFEANAENVRQWAEESLNFGFKGVVSTLWCRDITIPPGEIFETAWHAIITSAECFWAVENNRKNRKNCREDFNRRFTIDFLGTDKPEIVTTVFSLNNIPKTREAHPYAIEKAEECLKNFLKDVRFNKRYLETLLLFSWVERHIWNRSRLFNELFEIYSKRKIYYDLSRKGLECDLINSRRQWIRELIKEMDMLRENLRKALKPMMVEPDIKEFINARFECEEKMLKDFSKLLDFK